MITKKAKGIRKKFDGASAIMMQLFYSNQLNRELVDNCKPTREEYNDIAADTIMTAGGLYDLIMFAPEKWK